MKLAYFSPKQQKDNNTVESEKRAVKKYMFS